MKSWKRQIAEGMLQWHDLKKFVSVCVDATQTISLSFLARNPHKGPEDEISCESESGGGKEGPREDRESSWQRRAEENSWLEIAVQRMTQPAEGGSEKMEVEEEEESQQKSERWLLRPVDLQRPG